MECFKNHKNLIFLLLDKESLQKSIKPFIKDYIDIFKGILFLNIPLSSNFKFLKFWKENIYFGLSINPKTFLAKYFHYFDKAQ